ncbi:hypothetical protein N1614_03990 [Adlercreutzia muris]|uniref:CT398-like coiled coil hairpin domain-containing protein n=1 Tax=Adlercreutzia muris TaxID=1796610 RepID=A0A7C8FV63_9ACTN|nr:hypothetical protein [Adlercreutzia muris]KAB1644298.1 hypothetical protein F8D48_08445 [Adlercreutzia muris]MCR2028539.1 hypothetical protein [Adlercreutzia muris]MCU7584511.1 hypothetical protein [Adlercreutzia muris]
MDATREDIEGLFELQRIDLEIMRLTKELDELPQRAIIMAARDKKAEIQAKGEKVAELKRATMKRITRIDDEDASLAKKEAGVQAAIDAAHGDFRNVEARTKELAGIVRRRGTIAEDRAAIQAELDKIGAMEAQIALAVEEISAKEQQAIDSFQKQGGELKLAIAKLEAARGPVEAKVNDDLARAYDRIVARSGGVAIGVLDDSRCGVCRMPIESGRLIDLRSQAPLGICPACKRLLVIA